MMRNVDLLTFSILPCILCLSSHICIRMVMDNLCTSLSFLGWYLENWDRSGLGKNIGSTLVAQGIVGHSLRLATYFGKVRRNTQLECSLWYSFYQQPQSRMHANECLMQMESILYLVSYAGVEKSITGK